MDVVAVHKRLADAFSNERDVVHESGHDGHDGCQEPEAHQVPGCCREEWLLLVCKQHVKKKAGQPQGYGEVHHQRMVQKWHGIHNLHLQCSACHGTVT